MQLESVIGLEIHVQLKTASKMFCSCANIFGDVPPNSAICPICMGYPGTLPVPNRTAIEWTQKAGAAFNCELAEHSKFDRKSYFYPDLPKGYQISQYDQPFCGKGELTVVVEGTTRTIGITRIHLEEDAAKNIHDTASNSTLIDFNRAGTPLMEIVTEPDLRTPTEAKAFLQELQRSIRALNVSDADMEKGQLRCDANISLRQVGSSEFHPKTEIKNLNSFRNVERALAYEIERQTAEWKKGIVPQEQATRGFDAKTGKTIAQRTKEGAADYRYFPEPDIPPFVFKKEELAALHHSLPELPAEVRARFVKEYQLSEQQAQLFAELSDLAHFFEATASELAQHEREQDTARPNDLMPLTALAANVVLRQLRQLVERELLAYEDIKITPENFAELIIMLHQEKINSAAMPPLLEKMQETGGDPDPIIESLGLSQLSGEEDLVDYVKEVVRENPEVVEKIKAGKESALQFLMGQVMAKSGGNANPKVIIDLLRKEIL